MVDVSAKPVTSRTAIARGHVKMNAATYAVMTDGSAKKGDVLGVARLAGIMGAKQTSNLNPAVPPVADHQGRAGADTGRLNPRRGDHGHRQNHRPNRHRNGSANRRFCGGVNGV